MAVYGFTDQDKMSRLYGTQGFGGITDDADEDFDEIIDQIIEDAENTIVLRLSQYFNPTDMVGDPWVTSRCTWIACHLISHRRGNEHYFEALYTQAMEELNAIATGQIPPPIGIPLRDHSYPSMSNHIIDERFAVHKIRVRPEISVGGPNPNQDISFGYFWGWL